MFDNSNSIIVVNPLDGMTDDPEGFYLVSGMGTEEDPFIPGMSYTAPEPTTAPVTTEPATTAPAQGKEHAQFNKGDFIGQDTIYDFKDTTYFECDSGDVELCGKALLTDTNGGKDYYVFFF